MSQYHGNNSNRKNTSEDPRCRIGKSEDMADVVLFLASPVTSYTVGKVIIVDGGIVSV